mgnify:CR=1 FL=1
MSVLCLGEVWLELNAATAPELTESSGCRPAAGVQASAASTPHWRAGGSAGPAGSRPLWPQAGGPACPGWCGLLPALLHGCLPHTGGVHRSRHRSAYRAHTAGLALGPEQLEAAPFRGASAFCFSSAGLVDSPLRLAHLKALAAARDAGALCCYLPRLAQAAPYWPQREALCQTALQFLDRADVLFLEESDLLLLFAPGSCAQPCLPCSPAMCS